MLVVVITLSQNLVMMLAGVMISGLLFWLRPTEDLVEAFPSIFDVWSDVELKHWLVLPSVAVLAIVIGKLLAGTYQAAPPSIGSTIKYSYLAFVAV